MIKNKGVKCKVRALIEGELLTFSMPGMPISMDDVIVLRYIQDSIKRQMQSDPKVFDIRIIDSVEVKEDEIKR